MNMKEEKKNVFIEEDVIIINKIKQMNIVNPSLQLTTNVMQRISRIHEGLFTLIGKRLFLQFKNIFTTSPAKEECAISFISMGFFYLVLGLLLLFYIKNMPLNSALNGWLKIQSPVFILVALLLCVVGVAVWFMGSRALKVAHWGLMAYVLIFMISGLLISPKGEIQFIIGVFLSLGAVLTGISLNVSVCKYAHDSNMSKR